MVALLTALSLVAPTLVRAADPRQPQSTPAQAESRVMKMAAGTLVIVGGGLLPEVIRDRFLELAGKNARLVVIPTASRKAEAGKLETLPSYPVWMALEQERKVRSVVFLHTRDPKEANDPTFVKPLTVANAVWFSGGDQSLLTQAYKGTAVETELRRLLARGGVVGGTSAGAAVMSDLMIRFGNPVAEVGAGFGFLSGIVVDQHFNERNRLTRLLGVLAKYPRYFGLGIDEQTGVVVQGECLTVLGKHNVRFCRPTAEPTRPEVKVFASGDRIDLATFRQPVMTVAAKPSEPKPAKPIQTPPPARPVIPPAAASAMP
ncbi:MAG: cyanophycinase [Gemmataceae bacterium]